MTQLALRLHQPYARGLIEGGAILTVQLVADSNGNIAKEWWSEERPVAVIGEDGRSGEYTVFDLPKGGHYSVDITPPRGSHISREFLIENGEFRQETITLESSPHEYLGWQQYAGILQDNAYSVEAAGPYDLYASGSFDEPSESGSSEGSYGSGQSDRSYDTNRVGGGTAGWPSEIPPPRRRAERSSAVPIVFAPLLKADDNQSLWTPLYQPLGFGVPFGPIGHPMDWPVQEDSEFVTWFPRMPDAHEGGFLVNSLRQREVHDANSPFPRWICFAVEDRVDLVSVPWAWFGMDYDRAPTDEIRFLYDRVRPGSVDRRSSGYLNLSVQDKHWFGLLQFLASDRMNRAGELVDRLLRNYGAEAALAGKVKGPLAAVAGAIVLVTQAMSAEERSWDRWLENLANWFPGVPDGPILLGCRELQRARSSADLRDAFANLREGYSRGIPFFTATIRILDIALAQMSNDIREAELLRRNIAFVARRVDPNQPFPVIRLNEPGYLF